MHKILLSKQNSGVKSSFSPSVRILFFSSFTASKEMHLKAFPPIHQLSVPRLSLRLFFSPVAIVIYSGVAVCVCG